MPSDDLSRDHPLPDVDLGLADGLLAPDQPDVSLTSDMVQDSLSFYLDRAAKEPRLTAQQELSLAVDIEAGVLASERLAADASGLSSDDAPLLVELVRIGEAAKERLISANLLLVVHVARRSAHEMDLMDLIQEGNLGLMHAVVKFDHRRGTRFSTLAVVWIRQAIYVAVANKGRLIRVPRHVHAELQVLRRERQLLEQDLMRPATPAELSHVTDMPLSKVLDLVTLTRRLRSLDEPAGPLQERTLGDSLAATLSSTETRPLWLVELHDMLRELSPPDRRYLARRYGLDDGWPRSAAHVRRSLGLSSHQARDTERRIDSRLEQFRSQLLFAKPSRPAGG